MIKRLVGFALQNRALVVLLSLVLLVAGLVAFGQLPVEAYPNPVPPMVEVIAQPPGLSAEEVERYATIPLEVGLSGMPGLDHLRSQSLYALTDVKCYFKWGTRYEDARQEVINRLQFIALPAGVQAQLSPSNAIGEVYRFNVRGKGYSIQELKTAADWILVRQFKQVPGVADVVTFGGESKEYHVEVDPFRLRARNVTLAQLTQAIASANQNVGGQRLTLGEHCGGGRDGRDPPGALPRRRAGSRRGPAGPARLLAGAPHRRGGDAAAGRDAAPLSARRGGPGGSEPRAGEARAQDRAPRHGPLLRRHRHPRREGRAALVGAPGRHARRQRRRPGGRGASRTRR